MRVHLNEDHAWDIKQVLQDFVQASKRKIRDLRRNSSLTLALRRRDAAAALLQSIEISEEERGDDDADIVAKAEELYASGDVNIDDDPELSRGDDGVWVAAWVFVSKEHIPGYTADDEEDEEDVE